MAAREKMSYSNGELLNSVGGGKHVLSPAVHIGKIQYRRFQKGIVGSEQLKESVESSA